MNIEVRQFFGFELNYFKNYNKYNKREPVVFLPVLFYTVSLKCFLKFFKIRNLFITYNDNKIMSQLSALYIDNGHILNPDCITIEMPYYKFENFLYQL